MNKKEIEELKEQIEELKEQLENDIDRYEDTISYQLGFDKGKEYLQQKIDKAIEYIKETGLYCDYGDLCNQSATELLEILGGNK